MQRNASESVYPIASFKILRNIFSFQLLLLVIFWAAMYLYNMILGFEGSFFHEEIT